MTRLPFRTRAAHTFQREVGRLAAVFWVISIAFILRVLMGYRIKDVAQVRARYRALLKRERPPASDLPQPPHDDGFRSRRLGVGR